ncbi:fumarylacetoacetate hydrolase family protein [Kutzneria viridogrisea]|uniref:2-keto-4-pentenoate hydratase/2-oxohepta-3-ene-1,7-dioic acid hydratase in catechol pathway n=1 Tax=Kutzneria viridogrisea TaxID=47990 RepID=A0ABR6BLJ8_9PSEU|nr:2-keto-4-pentenoate hydratase/2-oxohepta-3-ene-1,7-dioic acid hydratase in catechol pathway [Kutzneria viridogrisea]
MRTATLAGRAALVCDGVALDIATASRGRFPAEPWLLFDRWEEVLAWSREADLSQAAPIDPAQLQAPSPRPRQVFAVASNYRDRPAVVPGGPDLPVVFTKYPSSIVGPNVSLPLPTDTVDWEVELVLVIGRQVHALPEELAWDAVAGVTVGQDYSERTLQLGGAAKQFSLGKSLPNFGPTGPVLVTPDELADRDDLHLLCTINGEVVQEARTSQMIFSVPELIARLSAVCTLLPGDLIFTGTPGGLGMTRQPPRYLSVGDEVVSQIEGIGQMRNLCTTPVGVAQPV